MSNTATTKETSALSNDETTQTQAHTTTDVTTDTPDATADSQGGRPATEASSVAPVMVRIDEHTTIPPNPSKNACSAAPPAQLILRKIGIGDTWLDHGASSTTRCTPSPLVSSRAACSPRPRRS